MARFRHPWELVGFDKYYTLLTSIGALTRASSLLVASLPQQVEIDAVGQRCRGAEASLVLVAEQVGHLSNPLPVLTQCARDLEDHAVVRKSGDIGATGDSMRMDELLKENEVTANCGRSVLHCQT